MPELDDFLKRLHRLKTAGRIIAPRPPTHGTWPSTLHSDLLAALSTLGAAQPYLHQLEAVEAARAGDDVALVTGTASGKTLAFLVPTFDAILRRPDSTAILIYPTKALAWDQFNAAASLKDALGPAGKFIRGAKYDGDTKAPAKKRIRTEGCNLLLTNPDELHVAILQYHHLWRDLLTNLRYVILDEVHAYGGYFGTNVSLVLRRLRAVCRAYGSDPTFIAASATVENAQEHVEKVIGKAITVVDRDTAGNAEKHMLLVDPLSAGKEPDDLTVDLIEMVIRSGLKGIVFANSRQLVERLADQARRRVGDQVVGYRAGYFHEQRQQVEERLKEGTVSVVVSTNALELGIDVRHLDVCILHGLPPTNSEAWQRLGRVGRKPDRGAVGVVVSVGSAMDEFCLVNPDAFFDGRRHPEPVVINPENRELLERHLACAAFEANGRSIDLEPFPRGAGALTGAAEEAFREGKRFRAYKAVDIRFIRKARHLYLVGTEKPFGEIDGNVAHRETHWGAVYLHGGVHYRVKKWETPTAKGAMAGRILCVPEDDFNLHTSPVINVNVEINEVFKTFAVGPEGFRVGVLAGIFDISELTTGYYEVWKFPDREEKKGPLPLKFPKGIRLKSHGVAIALAPETQQAMIQLGPAAGQALLHSLGHLLVAVLVESRRFGRSDMFEYAFAYYPAADAPTGFIYEAFPYGLGYADALFQRFERYLRLAYERVRRCPCENGCPGCVVLKARCAQFNEPLDKALVTSFLGTLLSSGAPRTDWALPAAPPRPVLGETWTAGGDYRGHGEILEVTSDGVMIRRPSGQAKLLPWRGDGDGMGA